jgi:hypothetical protein
MADAVRSVEHGFTFNGTGLGISEESQIKLCELIVDVSRRWMGG